MIQNQDFDQQLQTLWSDCYENHRDLFRSTLKFIHIREIQDSKLKALFNLQMIENKVETQIQDPNCELIKDFEENEANFLNVEDNEVLFYMDFENQQVITKGQANLADNQVHPVLVNSAPIQSYHSLIAPFVDSKLQQVLSGHITTLVTSIFKLSKSPHLRIGYNSILANCSINHLHLHLFYVNQVFTDRFPVESYEIINKYTGDNYTFGIVKDYLINTFLLKGANIGDQLQIIINCLLSEGIPHNIMFVNAETVYIYPRKSQFECLHEYGMRPAFIELSGLIICRNKKFYEEVTESIVKSQFQLMNYDNFDELTQNIVEQLQQ